MVFENDPFEDFKQQRQIEILEKKFTRKAESRRNELGELVRRSKPSSELASRIHEEMQEFFQESQQHVSRMISQYDHPNTGTIERKVQDEMADFFRESTETAKDLLAHLCSHEGDQDKATDQMVDHLKNVFKQSMDHIALVRKQYGPSAPPNAAEATVNPASMADLVQAINQDQQAIHQDQQAIHQDQEQADTFRYSPEVATARPDPEPRIQEYPPPETLPAAPPDLAASVRDALANVLPDDDPAPVDAPVKESPPARIPIPNPDRERLQPENEDDEQVSPPDPPAPGTPGCGQGAQGRSDPTGDR